MKKLIAIAGLIVAGITTPAAADSLVEGAKLCTKHLPRYEREYGIPTHLLSAIASTESGRYHPGLKIAVPWPWTINAEGKGYYFDSKSEAIAAAKRLRAQGIKSMDVGCMQVNLMHHSHAFSSLDEAFDPQKNIAYSASFLRSLYEEEKSWKNAAGDYHSKTPSRGTSYAGNVYDNWYTIVSRLREARLQVPESQTFAQLETMKKPAGKPQPKTIKVAMANGAPAKHTAPRMNSISVRVDGKERVRENGIIVVRPKIAVVDSPAPTATKTAKKPQPQVITIAQAKLPESEPLKAKPAVSRAFTAQTAGPRFIFNN